MNQKLIISSVLLTLLRVHGTAKTEVERKGNNPNFLIILADDLGYGDVQCYNPQKGKIPTPNIDRLSTEGIRFTDAHSSSSVCSPSRYSLLTGRYHWRTRLQSGIVNVFGEPLIAPGRLTIGSLVKKKGYLTACIGKWHLGWDWPVDSIQRKLLLADAKPATASREIQATDAHRALWQTIFSRSIEGGPTTRGFDSYFGTDVPNWPPFCFIENDHTLGNPTEFLPPENFTGNLASLRGPALKGWNLGNILPALGENAVRFISEAADKKQPFLLYLPLTSPHTPLAVNENWQGRSGLNKFGDFVMETDELVGKVLEALEKKGIAENTFVLFTSDNGCAPNIGIEELESKGHFPSGLMRGYKGDAWEGGHRIPFIIRWPGVVKPGRICNQLVQQADLFATIAAILGLNFPDNAGEDSYSILPLLHGRDKPVRENAVSCSLNGVPSIRKGEWKLIAGSASGGLSKMRDSNDIKLFNLSRDVGEQENLAENEPERVAVMRDLLEKVISEGRSTPGKAQQNDIPVRRYLKK